MDKFSYAIGLGIGQNLWGMGARGLVVEDFAQAVKDVLDGNQTAITHTEAREIVNKYFEELEQKVNAENIEKGKQFLEENKKRPEVVTLPSGLQYEVLKEGDPSAVRAKLTDRVECHYEGFLLACWTARCSTAPSAAGNPPRSASTRSSPAGWKPCS